MEMDKLNEIQEKLDLAYVELKKALPKDRTKWALLIISLQNEKEMILQEMVKNGSLKH